jgi:hypothetical protein
MERKINISRIIYPVDHTIGLREIPFTEFSKILKQLKKRNKNR